MITKLEQYTYDALEMTCCWRRAEDTGRLWEECIVTWYVIHAFICSTEMLYEREDMDRIFNVRSAADERWGERVDEVLY